MTQRLCGTHHNQYDENSTCKFCDAEPRNDAEQRNKDGATPIIQTDVELATMSDWSKRKQK